MYPVAVNRSAILLSSLPNAEPVLPRTKYAQANVSQLPLMFELVLATRLLRPPKISHVLPRVPRSLPPVGTGPIRPGAPAFEVLRSKPLRNMEAPHTTADTVPTCMYLLSISRILLVGAPWCWRSPNPLARMRSNGLILLPVDEAHNPRLRE